MNNNILDWMKSDEVYKASKSSKDKFITKSTLSILSVLSNVREQSNKIEKNKEYVPLKMILIFLLIVLAACSKNIYFPVFIIVIILVRLSLMSGEKIRKVLKGVFTAEFISGLILLPAFVFYKSYYSCISIILKISISISLIEILSADTKWNTLTSSLKRFKVPDIFILTLDIALKYIVLLGNVSIDMFTALKIRSVGRDKNKQKSLSGIVGTTFIKSKEMSEEMYQAMECRGFNGEYKVRKLKIRKSVAALYCISMILVALLYIFMEGQLK